MLHRVVAGGKKAVEASTWLPTEVTLTALSSMWVP